MTMRSKICFSRFIIEIVALEYINQDYFVCKSVTIFNHSRFQIVNEYLETCTILVERTHFQNYDFGTNKKI